MAQALKKILLGINIGTGICRLVCDSSTLAYLLQHTFTVRGWNREEAHTGVGEKKDIAVIRLSSGNEEAYVQGAESGKSDKLPLNGLDPRTTEASW